MLNETVVVIQNLAVRHGDDGHDDGCGVRDLGGDIESDLRSLVTPRSKRRTSRGVTVANFTADH